jgi:polyisoprenoid-binding protein YceI
MKKIICLLAALLIALPAFAGQFKIDDTQSEAVVEIVHKIGFSIGFIKKFDGTVSFDKANNVLKGLALNVDLTSLNTFNESRDKMLKGEDFLNVDMYPKAVIKSKKIMKDKIIADLTFRNVTKEVEFMYRFLGISKDDGGKKAALRMQGKVNREDFGITHNVLDDKGNKMLGEGIKMTFDIRSIQ